jgi:hypothetical protein
MVNGFDTFLALKGIRYDDKKEFFDSLEETVSEILTSSEDTSEKLAIQKALIQTGCRIEDEKKFKFKPGHRNFIMNLMLEIDSTDTNHFFRNDPFSTKDFEFPLVQVKSVKDIKKELIESEEEDEEDFMCRNLDDFLQHSSSIKIEEDEQEIKVEPKVEATNNEIEIEEAVIAFEGEDNGEFSMEEYKTFDGGMTGSYFLQTPSKNISQDSNEEEKKNYSKPERMYNDEFIAKRMNPRKRRITTSKIYPNTDDGTRARFRDLVKQSMECILPRELYETVYNRTIEIEKENDTCWICTCPICKSNIKLAVNVENEGKYCNYKRSNFERHLRFKHCGVRKKRFTFSNFAVNNSPSFPIKSIPKVVLYPQPNSKPELEKISNKSCTDSGELEGLK